MSVVTSWKILVVSAVFALFFVSVGSVYNYNVFFMRLQDEFQTGAVVTGWLGSLSSSMLFSSSPIAAVISPKIGNICLAVFGVILTSTGLLSSSFITSLGQGYLTLGIMTGVGAGFVFCSGSSLLLEFYPEKQGNCRATGGALTGGSVCVMVLGPVLNSLNALCGWRNSYRILSGLSLIIGIASTLALAKSYRVRQDHQNECDCTAKENKSNGIPEGPNASKKKEDMISQEDERAATTNISTIQLKKISEGSGFFEQEIVTVDESVLGKTGRQNRQNDKTSQIDGTALKGIPSKDCRKICEGSGVSEVEKDAYFSDSGKDINRKRTQDLDTNISKGLESPEREDTIDHHDDKKTEGTSSSCSEMISEECDTISKQTQASMSTRDLAEIEETPSFDCDNTPHYPDGETDNSQEDTTASNELSSNDRKRIPAETDVNPGGKMDIVNLSSEATARGSSAEGQGDPKPEATQPDEQISDERYRVLLDVEVWLWVLNVTFAQIGLSFAIVNYSSFMDQKQLSTQQISLVLTVFGAAEVAGKIAFAAFGDRLPFPKMCVTVASSLDGAVVSALLTLSSTFPHMVTLSIAWGLCRGGCYGACLSAASELFPRYRSHVVTAVALVGFGLGMPLCTPILGGLYDATGDYTCGLLVLAGSFSLSSLCAGLVPAKRKLQRRWRVTLTTEDTWRHSEVADSLYCKKPNARRCGTPNQAYEIEC